MEDNKQLALISLLSLSILSACGGGSSATSGNNLPNTGGENLLQPHQVSSRNLQSLDVLSRVAVNAPVVTTTADTITLSYTAPSGQLTGRHYQFFLNVDDNAETGFRFNDEAWDKAGTDYIVEDGHLFKSTANDTSWSWNQNVGQVAYHKTGSSVSVTIKKSLLHGLKPVVRIGLMARNANWDVKAIYPRSSLMAEYTLDITPPSDTVAPVIHLNGAQHLEIQQGSAFSDPGATAKDNVDGVITNQIVTDSNVDTSQPGRYQIIYTVTDHAGNTATATRTAEVIASIPSGIAIDGNESDWQNIAAISYTAGGVIKATNKNGKLYLLIDAPNIGENTQIFLDTDNNSATGFQFGGEIWNQGGADYMIENNHLDKAKTNNSAWSWKYGIASIEVARSANIVEMAIPTNLLGNIGNSINVGFVNRDANWNVKAALPEGGLVNYTLGVDGVYIPFTDTPNVSSIVKANNKWFGISGKSVLQDDGQGNITTVFTTPIKFESTLKTAISGKVHFVSRNIGPELISLDIATGQSNVVLKSRRVMDIENGSMRDFLLVSTFFPDAHMDKPHNFYKIDKNDQPIKVGIKQASHNFLIESVDTIKNEIHIKKETRTTTKFYKLTDAVGIGLEDEEHAPFANVLNITSVVHVNDKWFGISGKSVLQDDGLGNVTTVFTTPNEFRSTLKTAISGKIFFTHLAKGYPEPNRRNEFVSIDAVTGQSNVILSASNVIIYAAMKDYFLIITDDYNNRSNYYKIDSTGQSIKLGQNLNNQYDFTIQLTDRANNEIHFTKRSGSNVSHYKITAAVGVGLEAE